MPEAWQVSVLQTAYFLSLRQQLRRDDMMGQYIGNFYPGLSHCLSLFRKREGPACWRRPIIMRYPGIRISSHPKISIHTAQQKPKCTFLFPCPRPFRSVSAEALARSRRLLLFPRCKMRCAIRHSFCTAPLHAQRAMVCGRKDFGNPEQETIGRFLPGNMGRGISP